MAIDLLICGLLLISFVTNLLALGAFWVTPGLRSTANRFTINLLIINLIGCLILAPTLFLSGATGFANATRSAAHLNGEATDDSIEFYSKPGNHQMTIKHNGRLVEQEGIILKRNVTTSDQGESAPRTIETIYKCNTVLCKELTIDETSDTIVITEIEEENHFADDDAPPPPPAHVDLAEKLLPIAGLRCWSIDLAAALGSLAVLLIVGDTWCAVTDPLRYHTRISGVKSWIFIALTWLIGIVFGCLSAFRALNFESDALISRRRHMSEIYFSWTSSNGIFGIVFACLYFVVVIMLPFGFVCGMYWRIFSEARENGLRMRQNGSSPLLQSALNLNNQQHTQYQSSLCAQRNSISSASSHGGGLQMQIDQHKCSPTSIRRDSAAKILLLPTISDDDAASDIADEEHDGAGQLMTVPAGAEQEHSLADRNQNIILTLQAASGEIKRNYSARQLPLLGTSSQDLREINGIQGMRQVHSSPNLHRYTQVRQDSIPNESSPHLLGHRHTLQGIQTNRHYQVHRNTHALQIPAIHGSPKTLSYMSSLRHRLSNASSLFKYREESRAARISILVVIMFLVSYLPYGCLVLLQSRMPAANFEHSTQLAIFMILLANLSSPFIFAYRNQRVRRGLKRLLGLDTRSGSLKRQSTSSARESGLLRGIKSASNIQRSSSKVSTYSTNSARYLTPQSSLVSNTTVLHNNNHIGGNDTPVHATIIPLRTHGSTSTIINLSLPKKHTNGADSEHSAKCETSEQTRNGAQNATGVDRSRPALQRGVTIMEHIPVASKRSDCATSRHGLFKLFFKGSRNLSCSGATRACGQAETDATNVPTDV